MDGQILECFLSFARVIAQHLQSKTLAMFIHVHQTFVNCRWFSRFRFSNFDLSDSYISGRPTKLDNDLLRAENRGTVKASIIKFEHFQQIGKISRAVVEFLQNLPEEQKSNRIITGEEKWVLYDNPKSKRQWLLLNELLKNITKLGLHAKKFPLYKIKFLFTFILSCISVETNKSNISSVCLVEYSRNWLF